jgi:arylformamidase
VEEIMQKIGVSRRTMLAGAAAGTLLAAADRAIAQPAPRVKGPAVWLDMDQQALDDAYDQSKYAPNLQQVIGRYASNSEVTRERLGPPKRLAYGPTTIEGADLFAARRPNAPIHISPTRWSMRSAPSAISTS